MGRLFWKFFFIFWLAQLVTSMGVGAAIWLLHPMYAPPGAPLSLRADEPPSPPPPLPSPSNRPHSLLPPLMPIVAGSVVSLLFAALLAWYFAKPIRTLRVAFAAVAGGRLDTRVGAAMGQRQDELADLGKGFDQMADRLQALLDSQRRLLHDVSHELRSPLARLQAAADLLRQQPERSDEFIGRIERDTARMDTLVGELLTLARLDGGATGNFTDEIDLREIVADIVEDACFETDGKACVIEVDACENAKDIMRGSHELIQRALENVVRNAVRHSPEGGTISISVYLETAAGPVCVSVGDQGPGVFEGDLEAIFAPFFRSIGGDAFSGYGLGLAIARRVALAHGGSIRAANRPTGGLLVTLSLPCATAAGYRCNVG